MATFTNNLQTIRSAIYGKDMRQAIYEALRSLSDSIETTEDNMVFMLEGMFPKQITIDVDADDDNPTNYTHSLLSYNIPKTQYDPSEDGLLIWLKTTDSDEYDILLGKGLDYGVTEEDDYVRITFGTLDTPASERDSYRFKIYKNNGKKTIADYIKNYPATMHGEYVKTSLTVVCFQPESGQHILLSDTPFKPISGDIFDPDKDGLMIWRNDTEFIPRDNYIIVKPNEFATLNGISRNGSGGNDVIVYFDETKISFAIGDKVSFNIYKKPATAAASLTYGTTVGMSVGMTSAYQGTSEEVTD